MFRSLDLDVGHVEAEEGEEDPQESDPLDNENGIESPRAKADNFVATIRYMAERIRELTDMVQEMTYPPAEGDTLEEGGEDSQLDSVGE